MKDGHPKESGNDLSSFWLEEATKHLDRAADYVEYATTNGQANVQAPGLVSANEAIASAGEHIAAAQDYIQRAANAH